GFPKPQDDIIYRLRKSDQAVGTPIKPQNVTKAPVEVKNGQQQLYEAYCASCHKSDGKGLDNTFPPLAQSALVNGDETALLKVLLQGMQQTAINGVKYEGAMPAFHFLKDEEIIAIGNYIRSNFGNKATLIKTNNLKPLR